MGSLRCLIIHHTSYIIYVLSNELTQMRQECMSAAWSVTAELSHAGQLRRQKRFWRCDYKFKIGKHWRQHRESLMLDSWGGRKDFDDGGRHLYRILIQKL